mmetsp:Transcript_125488/g.349273  ORF Transcript_125488/g.349273 Transcript_125488/m.349273 type:complete len:380 (+) Transcript_125488:305-1444(+)
MDELQRVAEAHCSNVWALVEEGHYLDLIFPLHGLLSLKELAHFVALPRCPVDLQLRQRLHREARGICVDHVQLHRRGGPRQDHAVDEPALRGQGGRADGNHGLRDQDVHAVNLRRMFDALGDTNIGRQVGGVYLELAADGTFYGPAVVQTATEVHPTILAQPLLQAWVPPVRGKHRGAVHGAKDPCEGHQGHVRQFADLVLLFVRSPDDQEGVTIVFVRSPVEFVDDAVHDLSYAVHEGHHVSLQHLGGDAEVPYPGGPNDALDPRSLHHGVDAGAVHSMHVVLDNVSTSLAKTKRKQRTQLDDGLLEDNRLHELVGSWLVVAHQQVTQRLESVLRLSPLLHPVAFLCLELLVGHLRGHERVRADGLHLGNHVLYGVEH